ncbi:phage terminase large subunit family protein [Vibrio parahaemolyticus]|uniref:terminase gpA endonuclease subunit n=1 Tax=Vibrio alginolyticus TaxID=663 RepID=UPI0035C70C37|nr:phage terminase large subunit family protein [Vibrio parahaemolyticus]
MIGLQKMASIVRRNAHLIKPEMRTAMELAEDDLYINGGAGAVKYYADYAPYLRRPLTIMTSRAFLECIVVGSSRSAKTKTVLEAFLHWKVRVAAGDMFIYCSTQTKANEFGSKDIDRCVMNTPQLKELAVIGKETWKISEKTFKNMTVKLGSATETTTSASGYSSVLATDYDRSSDNIGQEGQKFELMAGRTTSVGSAGMAAAESSPGRQVKRLPKDASKHDHPVPAENQGIGGLYNAGTKERFYWRCRGCSAFFIPEFELISWIDKGSIAETAQTAVMCCPHCGEIYRNEDKESMNLEAIKHGLEGYFQEHQIDDNGKETGEPFKHKSRGSIWFEGTVIAARTWSRLVEKYLTALEQYEKFGDESALKAFENTYLGRNYVLKSASNIEVELNWLLERAREQSEKYPYSHGVVPAECSHLIMSVDIQNGKNGRFVCQATAFTPDMMRLYIVDRFEILVDEHGERIDPERELSAWQLLIDKCIKRTYQIEGSEKTMRPVKTVADMGGSGHAKKFKHSTSTTETAYQFVKYLEEIGLKDTFELTKGATRAGMEGFYRYSDNAKSGHKDACPYIELNSNLLANSIRNAITRKGESGMLIVLPYWMKGTKKQSWFDEIIAEDMDDNGLWFCPKGVRNEAVDLTKMSIGCSFWLQESEEHWKPDHLLPHDENPFVQLPDDHVFGAHSLTSNVTVSAAAMEFFNDW